MEKCPISPTANLLLDQMFGAEIVTIADRALRDQTLQETYDKAVADGRKPYLVTYGGSSPTGALGYAYCDERVSGTERPRRLDRVWHILWRDTCGSGLGSACIRLSGKVLGISIDEPEDWLKTRVSALASDASEKMGERIEFTRADDVLPTRNIAEQAMAC